MAFRKLCRQMLAYAPPKRQCSAVIAPTRQAACPVGENEEVDMIETPKPYECIPTPKGLPIVGTILSIVFSGGAAKLHEYCDRRHRQLGPIFREKLGAVEAVVLADKDFLSCVYSNEGLHPLHLVPEPWLMYNEMKGIKRGLFFMDGDQWRSRREVLTKILLAPSEVAKYTDSCLDVVNDVLARWEHLTTRNRDGTIPNLENELYNWSIESLGTIVFRRRLQCVTSPEQEGEMHDFVHNVQKIFGESSKLSIIPPKLAASLKLPVWTRFVDAADNALRIAREYTEARIAEIQAEKYDENLKSVLGQLLAMKNATHDEIVNIVADLILAAADTTSHATQWALYSLAKNPECQEKFLEQINKFVPPGGEINNKNLEDISYSSWIIKETLRLYPIASFLTRILPKQVTIGGYEIPAGKLLVMSQYTIGRNSKNFADPEKFIPERWCRPSRTGEHVNLSKGCMPFGAGVRSCIGKRVAELKMKMLLCELIRRFRLESTNDVGIAMRMITTPDKPIKLRLIKRT